MELERELIDYIRSEIAYDRLESLEPDEQLLDGALDSTDVLRLVVHVESRYDLRIQDEELVPENFETVAALAALIRAKQAA